MCVFLNYGQLPVVCFFLCVFLYFLLVVMSKVVSTNAFSCHDRCISKIKYYVSSGMIIST